MALLDHNLTIDGFYYITQDGISVVDNLENFVFQYSNNNGSSWNNAPVVYSTVESDVIAFGFYPVPIEDSPNDITEQTQFKLILTHALATSDPAPLEDLASYDQSDYGTISNNIIYLVANTGQFSGFTDIHINIAGISACPDTAADNYFCCTGEDAFEACGDAAPPFNPAGGGPAPLCDDGNEGRCCQKPLPSDGVIEDLSLCTYTPSFGTGYQSELVRAARLEPSIIVGQEDFPLADYIIIDGPDRTPMTISDFIIFNLTFFPFNQPIDAIFADFDEVTEYLNGDNYSDFISSEWTISNDTYVTLESNPDNCYADFDEVADANSAGVSFQQAYTGTGTPYICLQPGDIPEGTSSVVTLTNTITNSDNNTGTKTFYITLSDSNYYGCTDPIADNYFCDINDTNAALCEDGGDTLIVDPAGGNNSCIYYGCSSSYYSTYYSNTRYANNYNCQTSQLDNDGAEVPTQPCCTKVEYTYICAGAPQNSSQCNQGQVSNRVCDGGECTACDNDPTTGTEESYAYPKSNYDLIVTNDNACVFFGCLTEYANGDAYGTSDSDNGKGTGTGCFNDNTDSICPDSADMLNNAADNVLYEIFDSSAVNNCCFMPSHLGYCDVHGCMSEIACNYLCLPDTTFTTTDGRIQYTTCAEQYDVTEDYPGLCVTLDNGSTYYNDSDGDGAGAPHSVAFPALGGEEYDTGFCNDAAALANTPNYVPNNSDSDLYCDSTIVIPDTGGPRDCHNVCDGSNFYDSCGLCVCTQDDYDTGNCEDDADPDGNPISGNSKRPGDSEGPCGCIAPASHPNVDKNNVDFTCWDKTTTLCNISSDLCNFGDYSHDTFIDQAYHDDNYVTFCECPDFYGCTGNDERLALNHYNFFEVRNVINTIDRTTIIDDESCVYFILENVNGNIVGNPGSIIPITFEHYEHDSATDYTPTTAILQNEAGIWNATGINSSYTTDFYGDGTRAGKFGKFTYDYLEFFRHTNPSLDEHLNIDTANWGGSDFEYLESGTLSNSNGELSFSYDVDGSDDSTGFTFNYDYIGTELNNSNAVSSFHENHFDYRFTIVNSSEGTILGPPVWNSNFNYYRITFKTYSQINAPFGFQDYTTFENEGTGSNTYSLKFLGLSNPEQFSLSDNITCEITSTTASSARKFISKSNDPSIVTSTCVLSIDFQQPPDSTGSNNFDTIGIKTIGESYLPCTEKSDCNIYITGNATGVTSHSCASNKCKFEATNDFKIYANNIIPVCDTVGPVSVVEDATIGNGELIIDLTDYFTDPYEDLINVNEANSQYKITAEPGNGTLYQLDGTPITYINGQAILANNITRLKYTPYPDYPNTASGTGADAFTFSVTDIFGTSAASDCVVTILVNAVDDAPVFTSVDVSITINEESTYAENVTANSGNYTIGATDADGQLLTFSCNNSSNVDCNMVNNNSSSTPTLSEQSGEFQLQASTTNYFGAPENITFMVCDDLNEDGVTCDGITVSTTIPVTIANVNDPPTANSTTKTVSENDLVPNGEITLTGDPGPNEADTLTFIITNLPQGGITTDTSGLLYYKLSSPPFYSAIYNGDLTNGEFDLSVSPEPNKIYYQARTQALPAGASETDTFTFKVTDDGSPALSSGDANVVVTINGVDDPPLFTLSPDSDPIQFLEETIFNAPQYLTITDNDPDLPDPTIVVVETNSGGTPVAFSNQKLNITTTNDGSREAVVQLQGKQDAYGTTYIKIYQEQTGDSTNIIRQVSITNTPDAPTATSGNASVNEASSVSITLTGNDVDPSTTLTFATDENTWPQYGSVALTGNTATYTPNVELDNGATTTDYIYFNVTDETGLTSANPGRITITITGMNDTPELQGVPGTGFFEEDSYFDITIYANDPDPNASLDFTCEHDDVSDVGIDCACVGNCTGIASDADVTFRFTANTVTHPVTGLLDEFNGLEHFIITVSDGAATDDAEILVVSTPLNDVPVLTAISAVNVDEDSSITFQVDATDPDNTGLTFDCTVAGDSAPYLSCEVDDDGTDNWAEITITTINQDYFGDDHSVNISVTDGAGSDDQDVTINIISVNDLPVAQPITHSVAEESSVADAGNLITLASQQPANESGETIQYYIQTVPAVGTLHLPTDPYTEITANTLLDSGVDKVRYVPPVDMEGPVSDYTSFEYKAWDGTTDAST